MKIQEMSNEFDLVYNNLSSNQAPSLDEYQKSIILTQVQNEYVTQLLVPTHLTVGLSSAAFVALSPIIKEIKCKELTPEEEQELNIVRMWKSQTFKSKIYKVTNNCLAILNANIHIHHDLRTYITTFLNADEIDKLQYKPYSYPPKRHVWCIIRSDHSNQKAELHEQYLEVIVHPGEQIEDVYCRYVKKPYPIILNGTLHPSFDFYQNNEGDVERDYEDTIEGHFYCFGDTLDPKIDEVCEFNDTTQHSFIQIAAEKASMLYKGQAQLQRQPQQQGGNE